MKNSSTTVSNGGKRYTTNREYRRLITSKEWGALRKWKLWHNPTCERCKSGGRITAATCVHHIVPIESAAGDPVKMRQLAYSTGNLISLCEQCHIEIHRELASNSREANHARNHARTGAFVDNYLQCND